VVSFESRNCKEVLTVLVIDVAVRKEYARRSHEASEEWKQRMQRAEMTLEENDQTYRAVGAGICILFISLFIITFG